MSELSPKAQAIKDAVCGKYKTDYVRDRLWELERPVVLAVIRSLADQAVPADYDHWDGRSGEYWLGYEHGQNSRNDYVRKEILAIADELEQSS
jgi:hypothetical protein